MPEAIPNSTLPNINILLDALAEKTQSVLTQRAVHSPLIVGIQTGGLWVAEKLAERLAIKSDIGRLDIGFYRDDYASAGLSRPLPPTMLPWSIDNRHVLLVDDVLYTGRTIRAAINELFDYGRPALILLATLIARDGRELPVAADAAGMQLALPPGSNIKLRGPDPLRLELIQERAMHERSHD